MMNLFECVGLLFLWYLLVDFEWWEVLMGGFFFFCSRFIGEVGLLLFILLVLLL